eukprot:403348280
MIETNELNAINGKIMRSNQQSNENNNKEEEKRKNKLKELPNLKISKYQAQVNSLFKEIIAIQTGQVLDDVKGNAQILSGISQIRYIVQAICVKLILTDPTIQSHKKDSYNIINTENCYVCTFRIYPSTMFNEIKKAACEFWNKIEQKYNLTDEYFNNLVSYNDTVMNFFKTYNSLNPNVEAVVYLVKANQKARELNRLQYDSITLDEKKNKMKENQEGGNLSKFRKRTLDFQKIERVLPGLSQYREPNEIEVKEYLKRSNPLAFENNIWIFIMYIVIFVLTWVSLDLRSQSKEVYTMTKVLESWLQAKYTGNQANFTDQTLDQYDFNKVNINTKSDLYKYFQEDFSRLFFKVPSKRNQSIHEQESLFLQAYDIIGTVHTNSVPCIGGQGLLKCFEVKVNDDTINKTNFGSQLWEKYRTSDEISESYSLTGEFITVTGNGFTLDVSPSINSTEFNQTIRNASKVLFDDAARGLVVSFTTYNLRTDWWAFNFAFYEYGAHQEVISTQIRSYPFRPNIYESTQEKNIYRVDIIRVFLTFLTFLAIMVNQKRNKIKMTSAIISNYAISIFILIIFIVQAAMCFQLQEHTIDIIKSKTYFTCNFILLHELLCVKITVAYYSMFSMFTLHSNQVVDDAYTLYIYRHFWTFVFITIYIVFIQYTFMNIFTSIFFEEQRVIAMFEEVIYQKYEHLRRKKIVKTWLSSFFICCSFCLKKAQSLKKKNKNDDNELEAVNVLRDKMRQQKRSKKQEVNNRKMDNNRI